jgi:subtilisin family serine protease
MLASAADADAGGGSDAGASTAGTSGASGAGASAAKDPLRRVQWALDAIHLGDLSRRARQPVPAGAGALVAVVDSGVESSHPDLGGRVVRGQDFVDGDGGPDDPSGHGTHIAGIIAATAGNGIGGAGVAPAARILAIRVLDADNAGMPANVSAGINAAIAAGADVINLSLNWSMPSAGLAPVTAAVQRAADAGIAVVVASGNDDQPRCEEPFLPQRTLCVGAVDGDLRRSAFSSHGSGLGIVAPGEDMLSTWRGGHYTSISGTSQAAAITSGVAALLVGVGLHGPAVIDRLEQTARDIGAPGPDAASGYGLLDADRAVEGAAQATLPPILRVSAARRATLGAVRRRGLKVGCDAARPGTCRVQVRIGDVVVAKGRRPADGTGTVRVVARATTAGRRLLRERRSRSGVIEASLAGAPEARRPVTLRAH